METDPTAGFFTFHDAFEDILITDPLCSPQTPTLYPLDDIPNEEQNYSNLNQQQLGRDFVDPEDLFSDPVIWAFCNGGDVPGTSGINDDFNPADYPMSPPVSSVPQSQYNCACCQILREITHTNGMNVKRLEIHGKFGVITHAVLGIFNFDSSFQDQGIRMFDFHKESTQIVKKFLVQYFDACKKEGFSTMRDPLSTFYEALCVGLNDPNDFDDFLHSPAEYTGDCPNSQQAGPSKPAPEGGSNHVGSTKIPLAKQFYSSCGNEVAQRERTRTLKVKDFIDYFDLPIEAAARKMNICPTVVKKVCRKNGVKRWPYRKIRSLKRKISKKAKILDGNDEQERAGAQEAIQKYQLELTRLYEKHNK